MKLEQAERLMGINLIPPAALSDYLDVSYSDEEKDKFGDVPVSESLLLAIDPYDDQALGGLRSSLLIKDTHILIPPAASLTVSYFLDKFGFAGERNSKGEICFYKKDEGNKSWKDWLSAQRAAPGGDSRKPSCWRLVRKNIPGLTIGKNYREVLNMLKDGYRPPTVLEALEVMAVYYFWMLDKSKSGQVLNIPFWEEKNIWARLLYAKCTWTSDGYETGEKLVIGLNDASGGIYTFPLHPGKSSFITGILPVRDLK